MLEIHSSDISSAHLIAESTDKAGYDCYKCTIEKDPSVNQPDDGDTLDGAKPEVTEKPDPNYIYLPYHIKQYY
jgi:hypothetical protein